MAPPVLAVRRLVQHDQAGVPHQGRGQRQAPLLATGQRVRAATPELRQRHVDAVHQGRGLATCRLAQPERHLVLHPQGHELLLRVLEHERRPTGKLRRGESRWVHVPQPDAPVRGTYQAHQQPCQGGLPRAVRSDQGHPLTGGQREVHRPDHGRPVVGERESVRGDDGRAGRPGRVRDAVCAGDLARGRGRVLVRQPGTGGQQPLPRPRQHRRGRAEVDRAAVRPERQHDVRERPGHVHAVLHEHDGHGPRCPQRSKAGRERACRRRVQVGGRLVQDQDPRARRERPGQRQTLLLPAREPRREPALKPRQPHLGQCLRHPATHRLRRPAPALQAERDVVLHPLHDQLAVRVLEHEAHAGALPAGGPGCGILPVHAQPAPPLTGVLARDEARDRQGQRALPGPRGSHDQEALPGPHLERDVREGRRRPPGEREAGAVRADGAGSRGAGCVPRRPGCAVSRQPGSPPARPPRGAPGRGPASRRPR